MPKALTKEQYQKDLPKHLILKSDYKNKRSDVEILCLKCNQTFTQNANRMRINQKCPLCESIVSHRLSEEKVKERINNFPKIKFISYDINIMQVTTQCLICNIIETNHPTRFSNKKNRFGCKKCNVAHANKLKLGVSVNKGSKHGRYKYKKLEILCGFCGKKLLRPESDLSKKHVFCNNNCKANWQAQDEESLNKLLEKSSLGVVKTKQLFQDPTYRKEWGEAVKKRSKFNPKVGSYYSKISIELFDEIIKRLNINSIDVYYKSHEFFIRDFDEQKIYFYDFKIKHTNKLVEFNGDVFHGNPKLFKENDTPHPFDKTKTAKDLWDQDQVKADLAYKNDFELLYVWENDYKTNKEKVITDVIHYLGG